MGDNKVNQRDQFSRNSSQIKLKLNPNANNEPKLNSNANNAPKTRLKRGH